MRLINVEAFLDFNAGKLGQMRSFWWNSTVPEGGVQYMDMEGLTKMDVAVRRQIWWRSGYYKIYNSYLQARHGCLRWLWVDTCCIDKRSSAELSEAINSMYVWYANSDRCYAFLHDIYTTFLPYKPDNVNFTKFNGWPKWFSRGRTLQELIAPHDVHFFDGNWQYITSKPESVRALSIITQISVDVLQKGLGWSYPSVAQIMSWAADRTTGREEDRAYSLLGLIGVHMPMLYREGKNAFLRLQLEVIRMINDQSIFAWGWTKQTGSASGFLANDPSDFHDCSNVVRMVPSDVLEKYFSKWKLRRLVSVEERCQTFSVTNHGI
ncbi:hypothetical protein EDC04DRAFT_1789773 [Pisolithus marmoratus]|nr:hypothetical protein EDC04DRAFT_1789773 [Pisolithus marmoratus]